MLTELQHNVSLAASDAFWKLALKSFSPLLKAKDEANVKKETPQFTHLRRQLRDKYLPPIEMQIGYKHRETGEEIHLKTDAIPASRFPKSSYQPMYEIASIKVMKKNLIM